MGHRVKSGKDIWGVQRGAPQQGPFLGWGGCPLVRPYFGPAMPVIRCPAILPVIRCPAILPVIRCPALQHTCFAKIKIFLGAFAR